MDEFDQAKQFPDAPMFEQKESIKIIRSVTGKIGWEIKIFIGDDKSVIERIKSLDEDLKKIYPPEEKK